MQHWIESAGIVLQQHLKMKQKLRVDALLLAIFSQRPRSFTYLPITSSAGSSLTISMVLVFIMINENFYISLN
ncbi:MAG: hypothetical protein ACI31B_00295 [Muribaculaceae bacterium]